MYHREPALVASKPLPIDALWGKSHGHCPLETASSYDLLLDRARLGEAGTGPTHRHTFELCIGDVTLKKPGSCLGLTRGRVKPCTFNSDSLDLVRHQRFGGCRARRAHDSSSLLRAVLSCQSFETVADAMLTLKPENELGPAEILAQCCRLDKGSSLSIVVQSALTRCKTSPCAAPRP